MIHRNSSNVFWPKGRDSIVAILLVCIIGISGYATYTRILNQIDQDCCSINHISTSTFNFKNISVPKKSLYHCGPPKDGIPSLTAPNMVSADSATYLSPQDRVIGIAYNNDERAYPLRILAWHGLVNDQCGGISIAVTYCPMCDSSAVFDRTVDSKVLEFGISGLLLQSNVLFFDRQTDDSQESLWSQLKGEAISGPMMGTKLDTYAHQVIGWESWRTEYPTTKVMTDLTGYNRAYASDYYYEYHCSKDIVYPVNNVDETLPLKEKILGITVQGKSKAYPIAKMNFENPSIEDQIGSCKITIHQNQNGDVWVTSVSDIDMNYTFWFAWYAFHPDTEIYSGEGFNLNEWTNQRKPNPANPPQSE